MLKKMAGPYQVITIALLALTASTSDAFLFERTNNAGNKIGFFGNSGRAPINDVNNKINETPQLLNNFNNNNNVGNTISNLGNNINDNMAGNQGNMANNRCVQRSVRDFRPVPQDCNKFTMCSHGNLITFDCPKGSVFEELSGSCVPRGSFYDTCSRAVASQMICPPGASYKKAHPQHCARYYHCGQPPQNNLWENHLKECDYPMLFNEETERCEHHTMVKCGLRKEPMDPCEYRANICEGHSQCVPCKVRHPSCRGKPDGMNSWKGREGSPYYVVCADQRVVYNGMCSQNNGVQVFDDDARICKYLGGLPW